MKLNMEINDDTQRAIFKFIHRSRNWLSSHMWIWHCGALNAATRCAIKQNKIPTKKKNGEEEVGKIMKIAFYPVCACVCMWESGRDCVYAKPLLLISFVVLFFCWHFQLLHLIQSDSDAICYPIQKRFMSLVTFIGFPLFGSRQWIATNKSNKSRINIGDRLEKKNWRKNWFSLHRRFLKKKSQRFWRLDFIWFLRLQLSLINDYTSGRLRLIYILISIGKPFRAGDWEKTYRIKTYRKRHLSTLNG